MGRKRILLTIFICLFLTWTQPNEITIVNINASSSQALYYDLIKDSFSLTKSESRMLDENRFVVLNRMGTDDILDAFKFYWVNDLPILITTDTMLHTWHLIFDHILENLEENILYPLLSKLGRNVIANALFMYSGGHIIKDTLIYLLVTSELANSSTSEEIPLEIEEASNRILTAIKNEISLTKAISQLNDEFTKRFIDDFSQYKPRGHYTNSESLKLYFKLFKWLSRIPFFFDDYAGEEFLETEPKNMIRSSIEVTWILKETTIEYFKNMISGLEVWNIFKSFLDVVVGQTNSISPYIIDNVCKQLMGISWHIDNVDENILTQLQEVVLNDSSIPKPKSPYIIDAIAGSACSPKTFVLFGERLTFDSYALNHFVYPYVSGRLMPTSLDFAAACLESVRSFDLLEPEIEKYPGLLGRIIEMQEELNNISGAEKQTIHWQWIESLKDIAVTEPECNESIIVPEFMVSSAWLDEKLTTIMGSWTQLKHDTILYSKQSVTPYICCTPTGYVEPYPEFYKKLREISQLFEDSIAPLETIGYNFSDYYYLRALAEFNDANQVLETIAIKELTGISLNEEEKQFINNTYGENRICGGPFVEGWLSDIIKKLDRAYSKADNFPNSRTSLVADIHTDTNTGSILHLATGLFEPIIAFVPGWDNEEITVVGPVFSFYEFILQDYQRLNDEEWRGILSLWLNKKNRDNYDFGIFQRGFWAASYMVSTEITSDRIYTDEEKFIAPKWFTGEKNNIYNKILAPMIITSSSCICIAMIVLIFIYKKRKNIRP